MGYSYSSLEDSAAERVQAVQAGEACLMKLRGKQGLGLGPFL